MRRRTEWPRERRSIADVGLCADTHAPDGSSFDLCRYDAITNWVDRVQERPGHVPVTV